MTKNSHNALYDPTTDFFDTPSPLLIHCKSIDHNSLIFIDNMIENQSRRYFFEPHFHKFGGDSNLVVSNSWNKKYERSRMFFSRTLVEVKN